MRTMNTLFKEHVRGVVDSLMAEARLRGYKDDLILQMSNDVKSYYV